MFLNVLPLFQPFVMQAVIRGTLYPVENILELLTIDLSTAEILADYENMAVLNFAARLTQE